VCDMTRSCVWHDSFMCVTWLIHLCDMTRSCVWRDSLTYMTWRIRFSDLTHSPAWHDIFAEWHDFLAPVTWLIHAWDVTRVGSMPYLVASWHSMSLIYSDMTHWVTRPIHDHLSKVITNESYISWLVTSCVSHLCVCVTLLVAWHDSFMCMTWLITQQLTAVTSCVSHVLLRYMTHSRSLK